jgi:hypothetical protein
MPVFKVFNKGGMLEVQSVTGMSSTYSQRKWEFVHP